MTTTVNDDLDHDDVVIALRRESDAQPVRPAPVGQVAARGRRRRARHRASVAAVSTAAAVLIGAVAVGALADGPSDRVRTAEVPAVPNGPGVEPLLVPGATAGREREVDGRMIIDSADLDLLDAAGERAPWWRGNSASAWAVDGGIVLADGRRIATAQGAPDDGQDGGLVLVELDELGGVQRALPLGIEVPSDPTVSSSAQVVGAEGPVVDVVVQQRTSGRGQPLSAGTSLISVDVDTGMVETIIDDLADTSHRTAGDRIVSVRAAVSTTEPCLLDVRDRAAIDEVRTVEIACDAPDSPLPPMLRLVALDPTGRFAAVERTTLTTGLPELSLLVVDLDDETTTEVITEAGTTSWSDLAWDAGGTLRLAMPTDDPERPPTEVPSPAGGPEVEVVRYRSR